MAENEYKFNPNACPTAKMLAGLTNEELKRRYLLPNPKNERLLEPEFRKSLNLHTPDDTDYRFPLIASLMGVNLNEVSTVLVRKVESVICEDGYKLNTTQFCEDYEQILRDNLRETQRSAASLSKDATPFVKQTTKFMAYLILNRAYLQDNTAEFTV